MTKFWCLFLIFLFPIIALAQITTPNSFHKRKAIVPGTTTSISFTILNNSTKSKIYIVEVTSSSPSSITPISTQKEIRIPERDKFLYIVPIHVASGALKGAYEITLKLRNKKTGERITQSHTLRISQLKKLNHPALKVQGF